MGYARYEIDGMERGYAVPCKCHQRGCPARIDRGLAYLCYRCTQYFCGRHLVYAEVQQDCFAGVSRQVCLACDVEIDQEETDQAVEERG